MVFQTEFQNMLEGRSGASWAVEAEGAAPASASLPASPLPTPPETVSAFITRRCCMSEFTPKSNLAAESSKEKKIDSLMS